MREGRPDRAVQLTAAVTALREAAQLPPLPGSRTQRYLDAAAPLGERLVAGLWAAGPDHDQRRTRPSWPRRAGAPAGVRVGPGPARGRAGAHGAGPRGPRPARWPLPVPRLPAGSLTAREREVVALIAHGRSNRAIAEELFISPATAARHVANILGKLGYTSRSQVAAWAASSDSAP